MTTATVSEEYVCQKNQRKYYRFRADRFYGGIATADCMGCNMDCAFCWSYRTRLNPEQFGRFYTPNEVAGRLVKIAHEHSFRAVRISGNEPTLCKQHLLEVIKAIAGLDPDLLFMLETNGIKLGEDVAFVEELARCRNVHVRLSFKTGKPANFELITGRPREWFELQLRAVEHLYAKQVSFHVAIVANYAHEYLIERLRAVGPRIVERIEHEHLQLYPHVRHRMKERGLLPVSTRSE